MYLGHEFAGGEKRRVEEFVAGGRAVPLIEPDADRAIPVSAGTFAVEEHERILAELSALFQRAETLNPEIVPRLDAIRRSLRQP